ncbi:MAG TPA: GH3 auxin-responsive promoter family protein [Dehalococcoidales bacterium]|nr:GH3 auxin-responsive promoter family protein [Dehalococcoidales bacterium]
MITEDELFRMGNQEKAWNKYCGFLDLSLSEFMEIQAQLLMKQIDIVHNSPIARKFMPQKPMDVSEFRQMVRLTTYDDYAGPLMEKNEDVLAVKPYCWACTSGRGGKAKWVPYTHRAVEMFAMCSVAIVILACANNKGEVNISHGLRVLHNLPPPPYMSGIINELLAPRLGARLIPPSENYLNTDFEQRIQDGFQMALRTGTDLLSSMTSVLVKMGERFTESSGQLKLSRQMLSPTILWRLFIAWLRCKKEGRPMLPKDLWSFKGLACYGMDTGIYREQVKYYWGKEPLEMYGATEAGTIATQAWNKKDMTFFPASGFWEFIPEEEWLKSRENKSYQPRTVLLNEVKPGRRYEIVITNFNGMPFLRYRLGDLIKIVDLEDKEAGIRLPQMIFESRADDLIDIAGFTRLDEKTIWQAIANTKIKFEDWSARKEYEGKEPVVHLYIELKEEIDGKKLEELVHQHLKSLNQDYNNLETMLGLRPVRITIVPPGSFRRYYEERKGEGADLADLKPPHMNAPDNIIKSLLRTLPST